MRGVGDQRQRVRRVAEPQFSGNDQCIERDADGKREAEIIRRMAMPGMIVRVGMIVMIGHAALC